MGQKEVAVSKKEARGGKKRDPSHRKSGAQQGDYEEKAARGVNAAP